MSKWNWTEREQADAAAWLDGAETRSEAEKAAEEPTVAIHAARDNDSVICFVAPYRFPAVVQELLAGEGIWGAFRGEDGRVVVTDKGGEDHETTIRVGADGYVFNATQD